MFDVYLVDQRAKGLSEYTIEKAKWAERKLREFTSKPLEALVLDDVTRWHAWMFEQGLGKNTVHTHARVIRHYLRWAKERGYIAFDPPSIPGPAKPNRRALSANQLQAFVKAIEYGRNRLRNRSIFILFLATGLRLGELGRLRISDVDLSLGIVTVRGETSKSQRSRQVPLGGVAAQALRDYLVWGRQGSTEPSLFLNEQGYPLGLRGIHLILHRAARRAGVPWASPHVLRHTFATRSLLEGRDAFYVKALLGHESIRSTEIYMDMAEIEKALQGAVTPADRLFGRRGR